MENAIVIAKIAAIVYLAIAVGTFLNPSFMKKLLDDFIKSPGLTFLAAWITLIVGMLIILSYNVWTRHRGLFITILGWIATLKGVSLFIMPQKLMKIPHSLVKHSGRISLFACILGIVFFYFGFFS